MKSDFIKYSVVSLSSLIYVTVLAHYLVDKFNLMTASAFVVVMTPITFTSRFFLYKLIGFNRGRNENRK